MVSKNYPRRVLSYYLSSPVKSAAGRVFDQLPEAVIRDLVPHLTPAQLKSLATVTSKPDYKKIAVSYLGSE